MEADVKTIGIFLAYAPEDQIKNQGIGRLLGFLLLGLLKDPTNKVVIAMPGWYVQEVINFLKDLAIDQERIELISTPGSPIFVKIKKFLRKKKSSTQSPQQASASGARRSTMKRYFINPVVTMVKHWVSARSFLVFMLGACLVMTATLLAILFFVPLAVITSLVVLIALGVYSFKKARPRLMQFLLTKKHMLPMGGAKSRLLNVKNILEAARYRWRQRGQLMYSIEYKKLANKVNKRKDIHAWFIPALFWPEIKHIKAKKIVSVPDVVFIEFPTLFIEAGYRRDFRSYAETISVADNFICYSEYVKEMHLINSFDIDPSRISVIPHGVVRSDEHFKELDPSNWSQEAKQILSQFQKSYLKNNQYLSSFDFGNAKYIFYSSQSRPYKNILSLVKVYERLLRENFLNIKLILTVNLDHDKALKAYIKDKDLEKDVLCLQNVSARVLTALYQRAICAVNPTLFEGGFPFTFTEAYSVGTPSVMSNINVVNRHIKDNELKNVMLFDPYDLDDMLQKIASAVRDPDALYKMQAPLYAEFEKRSWEQVAEEYANVIKNVA